ncbi:MAG: bifunctional aldolase/short-chain dehydrogenase [Saprospiraceae bacterium]|nr:bifunctional aldolase/short-chain dehydrogenase [Saprospiraceae bacterium]
MKNRWNEADANACNGDPLKLRVYTSHLQGQEPDLVLHGGGNTSVKINETNVFGEAEDILYVKGSGWDLATIKAEGFAPVNLARLLQMAEFETLTDIDMVKYQRMAMTNPSAPNPSVEAILHALIPFKFVDHTHADAVVAISNTPNGEEHIRNIYGDHMLIVPYVMPGFILAKKIYEMTKDFDWGSIEGMILLNHGIFTFHDDAKASYDLMVRNVSLAEEFLATQEVVELPDTTAQQPDLLTMARVRKEVSEAWKMPVLASLNHDRKAVSYSMLPNITDIADRGPLTPDHIIRTKRNPLMVGSDPVEDVGRYIDAYAKYFEDHNPGNLTQLDPAPRWAIWPGKGTMAFGNSVKNMNIIHDITAHTMKSIHQAEQLGGWKALSKKDLFEMEYWSLEQEKLKKGAKRKALQGRVALVTGAASGIGKACVESLLAQGAAVAAIDISESVHEFSQKEVLDIRCDVTDSSQMEEALKQTIVHFGGLDMVIANAGIFPKSFAINKMDDDTWSKSLDINVTSQQKLFTLTQPYLALGVDPAIVIIGSKNVPAPGPGASAYSVAKAGLTQLGRIAAMEFGGQGIRVNILHPNAVYDTAIWTDEVLAARAKHYGLTVQEYKTNNILQTEVTSNDVANLAVAMLGPLFAKTTGAQLPIDGGNERII